MQVFGFENPFLELAKLIVGTLLEGIDFTCSETMEEVRMVLAISSFRQVLSKIVQLPFNILLLFNIHTFRLPLFTGITTMDIPSWKKVRQKFLHTLPWLPCGDLSIDKNLFLVIIMLPLISL